VIEEADSRENPGLQEAHICLPFSVQLAPDTVTPFEQKHVFFRHKVPLSDLVYP